MPRADTTAASFRQTQYRVARPRRSPATRLAKTLRLLQVTAATCFETPDEPTWVGRDELAPELM